MKHTWRQQVNLISWKYANYLTGYPVLNISDQLTWSNMSDWLSSVLKSAEPAKIKPVMLGYKKWSVLVKTNIEHFLS